ncbi:MAG: DNA repair exonuclease, partial [Lysobacterales bacterium]
MAAFRFLHAADIHLDSPLKGLAGHEGRAAERIRTATREAFDQLVGFAIEEQVAFLVVAGDLYDGDWRDYKTGLFFAAQMGRLNKAGIPVYLLYGNHDAESQITRRLVLPENVNVFGSRKPVTFKLDELNVALHGQSFRERDVSDNLALTYPEPIGGAFNIGVLHTGLGGMGGHANYAPCSLGDLVSKGYDYWALGHVHHGEV